MARGGPPPQPRRSKSSKKAKERKPEGQKAQVESAHQTAGKDDRLTARLRAGPPPRPQWEHNEPQFEMLTPRSKPNPTLEPEQPKPHQPELKSEPVKPQPLRTRGRAGAPPLTRHKSDTYNRVGPIMMTVETTTSVEDDSFSRFAHEIGVAMILPRESLPRQDSLKRRDIPFTNTVSYYKPTKYTV